MTFQAIATRLERPTADTLIAHFQSRGGGCFRDGKAQGFAVFHPSLLSEESLAAHGDLSAWKAGDPIPSPAWFLDESAPFDPWEALGSDHNSGLLVFGEADQVQIALDRFADQTRQSLIDDEVENWDLVGPPLALHWDLPDGRKLALLLADPDEQMDFEALAEGLEALCLPFGALTDDLLAHELLAPEASSRAIDAGLLDPASLEEDDLACSYPIEELLLAPADTDPDALGALAFEAFEALCVDVMGWQAAASSPEVPPWIAQLSAAMAARREALSLSAASHPASGSKPPRSI